MIWEIATFGGSDWEIGYFSAGQHRFHRISRGEDPVEERGAHWFAQYTRVAIQVFKLQACLPLAAGHERVEIFEKLQHVLLICRRQRHALVGYDASAQRRGPRLQISTTAPALNFKGWPPRLGFFATRSGKSLLSAARVKESTTFPPRSPGVTDGGRESRAGAACGFGDAGALVDCRPPLFGKAQWPAPCDASGRYADVIFSKLLLHRRHAVAVERQAGRACACAASRGACRINR